MSQINEIEENKDMDVDNDSETPLIPIPTMVSKIYKCGSPLNEEHWTMRVNKFSEFVDSTLQSSLTFNGRYEPQNNPLNTVQFDANTHYNGGGSISLLENSNPN